MPLEKTASPSLDKMDTSSPDKKDSPSLDKTASSSPDKKTPLPFDLEQDDDTGKYTSVHLSYTDANCFQITSGPGRMRTRKNGI